MVSIKLTAADGETHVGRIPSDWGEVELAAYAQLVAARDMPAVCAAVAILTGLPAAVVQSDASIALAVFQAAPFLREGPLPAHQPAPALLTHAGQTYAYKGTEPLLTAEQYEAVTQFVGDAKAEGLDAVTAAHQILGVLYVPVPADYGRPLSRWRRWLGRPAAASALPKQTEASVSTAAEAFRTLPMSVAYPIILDFFHSGSKWAEVTKMFLAVAPAAYSTLTELEAALHHAPASRNPFWNTQRWLLKTWIRHARTLCSPLPKRFSITGRPAAKPMNVPVNAKQK